MDAVLRARGDKAALAGSDSQMLRISQLQAKFTTFNTGGTLITTPDNPDPDASVFPNQLGFDHMQSYFLGIEGSAIFNPCISYISPIVPSLLIITQSKSLL